MAAIAVPRLLGFQERAESQADKQSGVQVRNALALLFANGEVTFTDNGTFTIKADPTGADATFNGTQAASPSTGEAGVSGITAVDTTTDVATLVHALTGDITVKGTIDIEVTVQADGKVEVTSP